MEIVCDDPVRGHLLVRGRGCVCVCVCACVECMWCCESDSSRANPFLWSRQEHLGLALEGAWSMCVYVCVRGGLARLCVRVGSQIMTEQTLFGDDDRPTSASGRHSYVFSRAPNFSQIGNCIFFDPACEYKEIVIFVLS